MTRQVLLRAPAELVERVEAYAQTKRISTNRALCELVEQALDCQRQGMLDHILEEVQALRRDLSRQRAVRKERAWKKHVRDKGLVVEARVVEP